MGAAEPGADGRRANGDRADHDASRTRGEHRGDRVHVAQAAADLHRDRHGTADLAHQMRLQRPASARAVEVDDVQPRRAGRGPGSRDRDGIVAVHRLPVELALHEPDAAATAQVDRRIDDHARPRTTATKFSRRRSPTAWLFSGWNWQAKTLSRTTLEANSTPYGVAVATSAGSAGTG